MDETVEETEGTYAIGKVFDEVLYFDVASFEFVV